MDRKEEMLYFPLWKRFCGSVLDKIIILVIFTFWGVCACPNDLADFYGTLSFSNEEISQIHGKDFVDKSVFLSVVFIILNLLYYGLSECILDASIGKRLLGGRLVQEIKHKTMEAIYFRHIFVRVMNLLWLMSFFCFFHIFGASYLAIVVLFFAYIDVPVFFKKQSLIDIRSHTVYIKRFIPDSIKGNDEFAQDNFKQTTNQAINDKSNKVDKSTSIKQRIKEYSSRIFIICPIILILFMFFLPLNSDGTISYYVRNGNYDRNIFYVIIFILIMIIALSQVILNWIGKTIRLNSIKVHITNIVMCMLLFVLFTLSYMLVRHSFWGCLLLPIIVLWVMVTAAKEKLSNHK